MSSGSDCERKGPSRSRGVRELLFRRVARVEFTTIYLAWFWVGVAAQAACPRRVGDWLWDQGDWVVVLLCVLVPNFFWPFLLVFPLVILRAAVLAFKRRTLRWWVELALLLGTAILVIWLISRVRL